MSSKSLTWSDERFAMLKVPSALSYARKRNKRKLNIQNKNFVAVLRNIPNFQPWLFPSMRISLGYRVPCLSGTITDELCGFCDGGTLHQSNGEYSFHCALKDHNLELLRVINNLLSCLLNETCILLTSESTKINWAWWKHLSWYSYLQNTNKISVTSQRHVNVLRVCVCVLF